MPDDKDMKSVRDLIGRFLQRNNLAMGVSLLVVGAMSMLDLVLAPLGVLSSLLLIWLMSWLLRSSWSDLGMRRPQSWGKTIVIGMGVGVISQLFTLLVLIPLLQQTSIQPLDYSRFENIQGNIG
jgi:hypothetical protein